MSDQETQSERRLAAVMVTDIAGYSSLMQSDEAGTFVALGTMRGAAEKLVRQHRGRIANTAGDSILAEFSSAVEAVNCAMALQSMPLEQDLGMELRARIGIHLGDVLERNGDLFGTAVNIAARLEDMAEPGGIVVSSAIRDATAGKLPASFADLGVKTLKNIEEPVRVYALSAACKSAITQTPRAKEALPLPNKPSIAVLPFDNLSGDREQEYFADGMVEEIITALSRMRWLFVIARNSSFAYKGRPVDVKQVGRELGVRYILEGSVRRSGSRVRIAGQLIDATSGGHVWADRFDGSLADIFDLQDQMTGSVVGAIATKLEQVEIERAKQKPTDSLDAYDYYLRGLASFHEWTKKGNAEALSLSSRAIELDSGFASAYALAARCYAQRKVSGWLTDRTKEVAEAERLAQRAVELAKDDALALCLGGWVLARVVGKLETGASLVEQARLMNPNLALAWYCGGWLKVSLGEPEEAIKDLLQAMRLSPFDLLLSRMHAATAAAHLLAGRFQKASSWAEKALVQQPTYSGALLTFIASNALSGRLNDAKSAVGRLAEIDPDFTVSSFRDRLPLRRPEDLARYEEGFRLAGLPE
jgi:TolB-like protein/class 3 adenylate cyclase/tetratricopeptide (TPR) repeat protein